MEIKNFGLPMGEHTDGYLYFIQMDKIGPVKIGFTKDVGKRLIAMQTFSPYPLKLLCMMPANKDLERNAHSCFSAIRMKGEWFLPHPKLFKEVDQIKHRNKINGFQMEKANPLWDFHPPLLTEEYEGWLDRQVKCENKPCKKIFDIGKGWVKGQL